MSHINCFPTCSYNILTYLELPVCLIFLYCHFPRQNGCFCVLQGPFLEAPLCSPAACSRTAQRADPRCCPGLSPPHGSGLLGLGPHGSSVFVLLLDFTGVHLQVTSSRYVWKFNVCALAFLKMFRVPAIGCRIWGQLPPWAVGPLPRGTLYHLLLKNEQGVAGVGPLCPCLGSPGFLLGRHEARRKLSCLGKGGGDSEGRPYLDCRQSRHGDLGAAWAYSSPCTAPLLTLGFGLSSLLPTHILTWQR